MVFDRMAYIVPRVSKTSSGEDNGVMVRNRRYPGTLPCFVFKTIHDLYACMCMSFCP